MPAGIGNKNAEKYPLEFVKIEVAKILTELINDKGILYIGELFFDKEYTRHSYNSWRIKFAEDDVVSTTTRKIDNILETRVVKGAVTKEFASDFTKFHLENNFGWKDRRNVDVTSNDKELKALTAIDEFFDRGGAK